MTRKTKILIAVAVVGLGALMWTVWPGQDERAVSITVTPISSDRISIGLTNSFETSILYSLSAETPLDGTCLSVSITNGNIMSRSATTDETTVFSTNRWTIRLSYYKEGTDSFVSRTRAKLALFADKQDWIRLAEWLIRKNRAKVTYSQEMLGNKPAPSDQK